MFRFMYLSVLGDVESETPSIRSDMYFLQNQSNFQEKFISTNLISIQSIHASDNLTLPMTQISLFSKKINRDKTLYMPITVEIGNNSTLNLYLVHFHPTFQSNTCGYNVIHYDHFDIHSNSTYLNRRPFQCNNNLKDY